MDKKTKRNIGLVLTASIILALLLFIYEFKTIQIREISRNSYGKGKKEETVKVTIGKKKLEETFSVEVQERMYGEEELEQVFGQVMDELPKIILGENKSFDHVEENLNLVTKAPDSPIQIRWEANRNDLVNSMGELQRENLSKEGELVELQGLLTYGNEEALYVVNVMVYPKKLTEEETLIQTVKNHVKAEEEKSREQATVKLPKEVHGTSLTWERKQEHKSIWIVSLGVVASILLYLQEKQKRQKEKAEREKQMLMDYPEIVNKIVLLVGAGLTVKNAWKKIVDHYEEYEGKKRFAYEEMNYVMREMQSGITEAECYEHFGKRIGLSSYIKLGALLSQNLRKGTKGLTEILAQEAVQAYEERRQFMKKQGEEISTKLLLPMSMMLIVVLTIVVIPAFLTISL